MTTDLKKQFFNTFGIEPIGCNDNKNCTGTLDCTQCPNAKYPEITDRILLELICIAMDVTDFGASDVETLKNVVLEVLIAEIKSKYSTKKEKKHIVNQVQALFSERED